MNNQQRIESMESKLTTAFNPHTLIIIDESHLHAGHEGAKSGKGHFRLRIGANELDHCTPLLAHRKIYQALTDLMNSEIHALSIELVSQ